MTNKGKQNEISCYALHLLTSENSIEKMMSQEVLDAIKESVGVHPTPNSIMVLFTDEIDMKECGEKLKAKGLKIAYEVAPVYIDKKYIDREVS